MRVAITGGTGLVGDAVRRALHDRGDSTAIVSRSQGEGRILWSVDGGLSPAEALSGFDAVVHLAGAGVADRRWSAARKRELMQSREQGTRTIVEALRCADPRPRVLVSASGVGYYGDGRDQPLTEAAPSGDDYLAQICRAWEHEADQADALGVRVVKLRFGVVLAPSGGALAKMLPAFRLGAGGPLGSGKQYMAWVHIADAVAAVLRVLSDDALRGAFNVTAPAPVDNATFTAALGAALGRPAFLRVPAFGLRVLFGELAEVLLTGQRALPQRLQDAGFVFEHDEVRSALDELLKPSRGT